VSSTGALSEGPRRDDQKWPELTIQQPSKTQRRDRWLSIIHPPDATSTNAPGKLNFSDTVRNAG